jgi:thioredoxin reductase
MQAKKVVIIGAGPAGVTAAMQLKRYGIPFVLLERERVGGLLWNANLVENYPGFPAGVSGPRLIGLIEEQMERIGVEVVFNEVLRVTTNPNKKNFIIKTKTQSYTTTHLIIASGTKPKPVPLHIPKGARDKVFCDIYHLLDVSEKRVAIIGAGDAAFDYALNLVKRGNFVTILNRGRDVKCLRLLWERAMAESNIVYRAGTSVREVEFEETLPERGWETTSKLKVWLGSGEILKADYLLIAIGRIPQTDFLSDEIVNQEVKCLYLVGDVKNGLYRQAAIAAGDGLRAAMQVYHSLEDYSI